MNIKKRYLAIIVVVVALVIAWMFYHRSMDVRQLCPELDFERCTGMKITATLSRGGSQNQDDVFYEYTLSAGDPGFAEILDQLRQPAFRRKLGNLLPVKGTPVYLHSAQPGEFRWEIVCEFSRIATADGSGHEGSLLQVSDFYGEHLALDCMGNHWNMSVSGEWRQVVFDRIQQFCPDKKS